MKYIKDDEVIEVTEQAQAWALEKAGYKLVDNVKTEIKDDNIDDDDTTIKYRKQRTK